MKVDNDGMKLNFFKKVIDWYGFRYTVSSDTNSITVSEIDIAENSYVFSSISEALKSFYEVMIGTNENLQICDCKIWSDDELRFVSQL